VLILVDRVDVEIVSLVGIDIVDIVDNTVDISDCPDELAVVINDCKSLVVSTIVAEVFTIVLSYKLVKNITYHVKCKTTAI
jgi:hypothetical protein